jgi:hypothetical protein
LADRSRDLRDLSKLEGNGFPRETFTLPLNAARLKARQILDELSLASCEKTFVKNEPK